MAQIADRNKSRTVQSNHFDTEDVKRTIFLSLRRFSW